MEARRNGTQVVGLGSLPQASEADVNEVKDRVGSGRFIFANDSAGERQQFIDDVDQTIGDIIVRLEKARKLLAETGDPYDVHRDFKLVRGSADEGIEKCLAYRARREAALEDE